MDATYLVCTILACTAGVMTAEEFPVHVRTAGKQSNVAVTAERSGRFAVAWSSYFCKRKMAEVTVNGVLEACH